MYLKQDGEKTSKINKDSGMVPPNQGIGASEDRKRIPPHRKFDNVTSNKMLPSPESQTFWAKALKEKSKSTWTCSQVISGLGFSTAMVAGATIMVLVICASYGVVSIPLLFMCAKVLGSIMGAALGVGLTGLISSKMSDRPSQSK